MGAQRDRGDSRYYRSSDPSTAEVERLHALERWSDPQTIRCLEAIGVRPGSTCLEAGAGTGSVARWLAGRVGEHGSVEAVDLHPEGIDTGGHANIVRRKLDLETDGLPGGRFDVVHARCLLLHLADPSAALKRMAGALRPGGWLLVEDHDFAWCELDEWPGYPHQVQEASARVWRATRQHASRHGVSLRMGSALPRLVAGAGLTEIGGEVWSPVGDPSYSAWARLTLEIDREKALQAGTYTAADLELLAGVGVDGEWWAQAPLVFSIRGRRPTG
jgi:SAM-dependent methyltransferase